MDHDTQHPHHTPPPTTSDKQTPRNSTPNGALFPAPDTAALPALSFVAAQGSSSASPARHAPSSSLDVIAGLWSRGSSVVGDGSSRNQPSEPPTFLRPVSAAPHGRRHQRTKSAGSSTTVSSQPVIVRTYQASRASSRARSPHVGTLLPPKMSSNARLPPAEEFSFDAILRAVEPDIQSAIDAIAEICARSRMSLADEHSAHIPPLGEIREGETAVRGRGGRFGVRTMERTLTAVPEASSSSERLAGGSKASSDSGKGKGKNSAYGSLKSIITGRKGSLSSKGDAEASFNASESTIVGDSEVNHSQKDAITGQSPVTDNTPGPPPITLISSSVPSKQLSLDASFASTQATQPRLPPSNARTRTRSSSLSAWLPWSRLTWTTASPSHATEAPRAESRLKELLQNISIPNARTSDSFG